MPEHRAKVFYLDEASREQPNESTLLRTLVTKEAVGPEFSFAVLELKKGGGHKWQASQAYGEVLFILEGEGVVQVEGQEEIRYKPGTAIVIPRGVPHQHINWGEEVIRAITVHFPARS